jgi:hypothetical protein
MFIKETRNIIFSEKINQMSFIIISIIFSAIFLLGLLFEMDRWFSLSWNSVDQFISSTELKPNVNSFNSNFKKIIVILSCEQGDCALATKSLLDQSVKVDEIVIKTTQKKLDWLDDKNNTTVKIVSPTFSFKNVDPIVKKIFLQDNKIYAFDFIENQL